MATIIHTSRDISANEAALQCKANTVSMKKKKHYSYGLIGGDI